MSLVLNVGLFAYWAERNLQESIDNEKKFLDAVNRTLLKAGLKEHIEPLELKGQKTLCLQMYGYSGIHYLRRIAANLTEYNKIPQPGDKKTYKDPLSSNYGEPFSVDSRGYLKGTYKKKGILGNFFKSPSKTFEHLIIHSDCQGFYIPQEFDSVIYSQEQELSKGGMNLIGSSYRLLEECKIIANELDLPLDLDPESREVWELPENQGVSEVKWKKYGIESYTCLRLYNAAKHSILTESAVIFT